MNLQPILQSKTKDATIFRYSDFGFPVVTHCKIFDFYKGTWAQYRNIPHIVIRPYRSHKKYILRILPHHQIAIFKGVIELAKNKYVEIKETEEATISNTLLCFDREYLDKALQNTEEQPVFLQQ
jgi:hypothetical protein